jgi:methyltransferase (TIGR00027 family)
MTPITHVSDTARWVACYRALETERPDALFRDPHARRLAGDQGFAILDAMPQGRQMSWPIVTRTAVMDAIILQRIQDDDIDTVLDLAAGLDARPWRLALPPPLRWIDVDHADMLDYKATILAGEPLKCRYESIATDLTDGVARRELFRMVGASSKRVLVITEGLLIYLNEAQVTNLALDLHAIPAMQLWLTDLASPGLLRMMEKNWAPAVRAGNAPFQFGPADAPAFFSILGWREVEYRSTFFEGRRLGRTMKFGWLWEFLDKLSPPAKREAFRRFATIAVYQRA